MKSTRRLLYSGAVVTVPIFCGGAQAEDWKVTGEFGFTGVGKTQEMERVILTGSASSPAFSLTTRAKTAYFIAPA